MIVFMRAAALGLIAMALAALLAPPAGAAEKLRVGKAVPEAFSFVPLDIGMRKGIFAKHGLEIESIAFAGDARMQQAMASDSLDIALGSGPAMAFIAKGAPIKAVTAMAGPPLLLAISVREAIRDAVAAFGAGDVVTFDSPATPERVFFAVRRVRTGRAAVL